MERGFRCRNGTAQQTMRSYRNRSPRGGALLKRGLRTTDRQLPNTDILKGAKVRKFNTSPRQGKEKPILKYL